MLKIITSNDKLSFDNKDEVIKYFDKSLSQEPKDQYFENGGYWLEIEGQRIESVDDWEYWKENFNENLHNILEELKDLIDAEFTLSHMENTVKEIIGAVGDNKNSIFDGETDEYIETGSYSYSVWIDEEETEAANICIYFEVLDKYEDNLDTTVKITDIELL